MIQLIHPRTTTHPFTPKEKISALKLVPSSLTARRLANALLVMMLLAIALVVLFVWPIVAMHHWL